MATGNCYPDLRSNPSNYSRYVLNLDGLLHLDNCTRLLNVLHFRKTSKIQFKFGRGQKTLQNRGISGIKTF